MCLIDRDLAGADLREGDQGVAHLVDPGGHDVRQTDAPIPGGGAVQVGLLPRTMSPCNTAEHGG